MKKLIYLDPHAIGIFHCIFNASSLRMFSAIFDNITYVSTVSSRLCVKDLLNGHLPNNVKTKRIIQTPFDGKFNYFLHLLLSNIYSMAICTFAPQNACVFISFNSLWCIKYLSFISKYRKIKIIQMYHGELEFLSTYNKLNFLSRKGLQILQSNKFEVGRNLYFCVAGESIHNNLKSIVSPKILPKFIHYEHTFIPHRINKPSKIKKEKKRIGFIGSVNKYKGIDNILSFSKKINHNEFEIYALGRIYCDINILKDNHINVIPGSWEKYVDNDILIEYIDMMDYVVFLYPTNLYKFTASGALFEAIDREKIILSLHNDYFDSIFNRVKIGKQFNDLESIVNYLNSGKIDIYIDFSYVKNVLSPEYEANRFKELLKQKGIIA